VALAFRRVLLYGGFHEETRVYHCAWRCSGERRLACRPTRAAKGEDVTGGIHTYGDETITWTSTGTGGALGSALLANAAAAITVHSGAQISVNNQITTWLDGLGLAQYATVFAENAINSRYPA
jgi:hypothetical protein